MSDDIHLTAATGHERRWQRRWTAIVDWLGAQKPLNLILGAVILINIVSVAVRLL